MVIIYHECFQDDFIYNCQLSKDKKESYISKYGMELVGDVKEYSINHIKIKNIDGTLSFESHKDISSYYENKYLVQEVEKTNIMPFSFYETDCEEQYTLYQAITNNGIHSLKEYDDFITYEKEIM